MSSGPPPPPAPPSEEDLKEMKGKVKSQNRVHEDVEIDFEKYSTPYDITKPIDWDKIKRTSLSEDNMGGNGVFFLQAGNDEIFVLKGSSYVADEIFSTRISRFFGIRTPLTRLIEYKPCERLEKRHPEDEVHGFNWYGAKKALTRCGEKNLRVKLKIERTLHRAFYLLMEFVPGVNVFSKKFDLKILTSKKHLNDIGRIFIFDLVQNSSDRFPIPDIFVHEGNPQNLLFLESEVVAIDQSVSPIKDEEHRVKYLREIKSVVTEHCEGQNNRYIESIVSFLKYNIIRNEEVKIDDVGKLEIWKGMDDMFRIIQERFENLVLFLNEQKEEVKKLLTGEDWKNVYAESVDRIDCNFITEILKVISSNFKNV